MTVSLEKKLAGNEMSTRRRNVYTCCETAVFRHSRKSKIEKFDSGNFNKKWTKQECTLP